MPEIFAHRGLHISERENTIGAFKAAVALGVDGVELDARHTRDGVLVVHHDAHIGHLIIADSLASELPDYVPTLEDVMKVCDGVTVNVEIKNISSEPGYDKTGDFARSVLNCLHENNWESNVIISSFDKETCAVVRSFDSMIDVAWLLWKEELSDAITQCHVLGFNAINPHFSQVNAVVMQKANELGIKVNTWTVNKPEDITAMAQLGVNTIITDDPETAMSLTRQ